MRRALAIVLACGVAAAIVGEARQRPLSGGLIVEAVARPSAPDLAGLKAGDELISWTRSASPRAAAAHGEFRTPFDAREFEIEQLPRGGTSVTAARNGSLVEIKLIPGFWGVSVRPDFSDADLAVYESGRDLLDKRPTEALAAWGPLIDGLGATGDRGSAAWLLTRVASSLVATDELQAADALFDRAAALVRDPASSAFEAMVWEARGSAYHGESFGSRTFSDGTERPPKLVSAVEAHMRARSLRVAAGKGGRTLAIAESELLVVDAVVFAPLYFSSANRDAGPATSSQLEQLSKQMLDTVTDLAPRSFAHARGLYRISMFNSGSQRSAGGAVHMAEVAARPSLQQAWSILDAVEPTHALLQRVLRALQRSLMDRYLPQYEDLPLYEAVQRRRMRLGEETGDRALLEEGAMGLARAMVRRGAIPEALSVRDELIRSGSSYSSLAGPLVSLASELEFRGHLEAAASVLESIVKETSPPDRSAWSALANLHARSGNPAAAKQTLTSILAHPESAQYTPIQRVSLMINLVHHAMATGDFVAAETWAQRALVEEKAVPNSNLAARYDLLTRVAEWRADWEKGREYRILAIEEGRRLKNPTNLQRRDQALRLTRLSPDDAEAAAYFAQDLDNHRKANPGTLLEAFALSRFADSQLNRGDLAGAERSRLESLALMRRVAPGSDFLVEQLNLLGALANRRGDNRQALAYYEEVLALAEDARPRSGDSAGLDSAEGVETPVEPYVNVVAMMVAGGDAPGAFKVAERSRGRTLVQMLRSRGPGDTAPVPPPLGEERRRLEAQYDEKQRELQGLSTTKDPFAVAAAAEELNGLWRQLKDVDRRIAALDPNAAALAQFLPAGLADVRARLDPGTVLLSYLTGGSATYLFVVTPASDTAAGDSGIVAHRLPVTAAQLRSSIAAFRNLISWDDRRVLVARARALYDTLVLPAERQIAGADRVLLSLDGPLLSLPFGALVRDERGQFLTEWKPLHTIPSMSVYLEALNHRRPMADTAGLVAFGDPAYASARSTPAPVDAEVESLLRSGGTLSPLPGTRREVSAIAGLFGARATTYLGASSTETRAKALDRSFRFIHFAVHGRLNARLPMNSALVFATPAAWSAGEDNGVLQAWEIFRYVQIDADLVTLSACDSGLGKEVAGEGLIGLTRAFLYAGARTVAASLWKVEDGATVELMTRFYANLHSGQPKDLALQNAQVALIRLGRTPGARVDYSSPARWAAFTLTGDWK